MKFLRKTNQRSYPPGLERVIFGKLPKWLLASTLIPVMMSVFIRLLPLQGSATEIAKQHLTIDILSVAIAITGWTAIFTIAIGCVVVIVMKGPAYVADSYKMDEANYPRQDWPQKKDD